MASAVWSGPRLALLALLVASAAEGYIDRGFLLTAPKVLIANTVERFCLTFFNLRDKASVSVYLLPKKNSTVDDSVAQLSRTFYVSGPSDENVCFDFTVPKKAPSNAYLRATVRSGFFSSSQQSRLRVLPFTLVTLVQTDKSKYKAGDLVQFRVVTLKSDLTAMEEVVDQIFITTPGGTRLAQFDKVATRSGIIQKKFQLTEEPPLGRWTIHVKRSDNIVKQPFEVEEYVLPRFEVTITGPKYITNQANTVTLKVCATYTFGKPVPGAALKLLVSRPSTFFFRRRHGSSSEKPPPSNVTFTEETDTDGCVEIDVVLAKIGLGGAVTRRVYASRIKVEANVTESGTGILQQADITIPIQNRRVSINMYRAAGSTFIKPQLPYFGYATIKDADDEPLVRERIQVCYTSYFRNRNVPGPPTPLSTFPIGGSRAQLASTSYARLPIIWPDIVPVKGSSKVCREYDSDKNGRIKYRIPGLDLGVVYVNVNIKALRSGISSTTASSRLKMWFSPSNSFLSIEVAKDPFDLKCSGSVVLRVRKTFSTGKRKLTYMIMTRGQIIRQSYVDSQGLIRVPLGFDVSPVFKVLVYFVNFLGEIVSDSKAFNVANCFQNRVSVSWDRKQVKPGETATLTVRGAPNSLCGVSALDRSVELLSSANKLTADSVFAKLRRFIIRAGSYPSIIEGPNVYCKRKTRHAPAPSLGPLNFSPSFAEFSRRQAEVKEVEKSAGDVAKPSNTVYYYTVDEDDAIKAYDEAGYLPLTNLVLETRPCERRKRTICRHCRRFPVASAGGGGVRLAFARGGVADASAFVAESARSAPAGRPSAAVEATLRSFFPETFLFLLEGLGANGVADLTQKMPDTITRWVGSAFCSNLKSGFGLSETASITTFKPFFAQINLPFSVKRGELLRLKVSVFNFLPSDLSVLVELAPSKDFSVDGGAPRSQTVCVRADRPSVVEFPLQFSSLGDVDITATVRADGAACGKPNTVQASDALRRSLLVKPEGFPQEEVSTAFVCQPEGSSDATVVTFPLSRLPTLVPDSQRAWISVVGDLIAPSSENLERLVRVPTGCGEQNMIGFVPNIFVRRYLEEVKLITDALRTRTTNNMRTGYQRELRFRRSEGSYSAFPERKPKVRDGSLWLTAYVVRSYAAASRYIPVDAKDLDISTRWIVGRQEASGEFSPHGALFHREMRGGVGSGGNEALTAYVVLALMEAGGQQAAVNRGLDFLVETSVFNTLYAEVLVAHALVQGGRREGAVRLAALLKKGVRRGGQLHWEGDRSSAHGGSRAVDVEMTSYMVLSLLKLGGRTNLGEAALAIKWVNAQRNSVGGFVSTQDTVVALAALTEFAIATYSSKMSVDVTVSARGGFSERFSVTAGTRLLTQQRRIPDPLQLPNSVKFEVVGEGCAVVQSLFRYNTKTAFPDPSFNLRADITKKSSTCSGFTLSVCASFKKPNVESNMAIIEIEMISGFVSVDKTLRDLEKAGVIQKWEFKEGKVSLYFDEFTTTEVCFSVRFTQAVAVEKLKPAVVRIYDYYAVEDRFEVEYGPPCK